MMNRTLKPETCDDERFATPECTYSATLTWLEERKDHIRSKLDALRARPDKWKANREQRALLLAKFGEVDLLISQIKRHGVSWKPTLPPVELEPGARVA